MTTESLEVRLARLEGSYEQINERLGTIESRLDSLGTKVDNGFTEVRREFTEVRREMRTQFYWLLGVIIVGLVVPIVLGIVF